MKMSARTRSGERSGSLRIAASPLPTETTSIPWSFSASVTIFWMLLLSSATRTLATKASTTHRPRTLRTPQAVTLRNLIPNTLQRVSQHEPDDVSNLFRNVPFLTSLEVAPFPVLLLSGSLALPGAQPCGARRAERLGRSAGQGQRRARRGRQIGRASCRERG